MELNSREKDALNTSKNGNRKNESRGVLIKLHDQFEEMNS